jgi:hypothetical protein
MKSNWVMSSGLMGISMPQELPSRSSMSSALTRIEHAGDQYLRLPASFNSAVDDCHDSEVLATSFWMRAWALNCSASHMTA